MHTEDVVGFRLSPQQRWLWALQHESHPFAAQCAVLLTGPLMPQRLEQAVCAVAARHESLRTTFKRLPGMKSSLQVIDERITPDWHQIAQTGNRHLDLQVQELLEGERRRSFDLEQGPIMRALLTPLGERRHLLLLTLPALCADSSTLNNIVGEISRAYAQADGFAGEPLQYVQFSEWQNELQDEAEAAAGREYWDKQGFKNLIDLRLPFEEGLDPADNFEPQLRALTLDAELCEALERCASGLNVTTETILFACWQTLLARLMGKSELIVAQVTDGRKYEELQEALGLFARSLPIRCQVESNSPFVEIVDQLDKATAEASRWQDYVAAAAGHDAGEQGGFPFAFEYQRWSAQTSAAGLEFSVYRQYSLIDRFRLKLVCAAVGDRLIAEFHYDPSRFRPQSIERVCRHFETLARSAAANPLAMVSELEILSAADRRELLEDFNQTAADYPAHACIHHLIEAQAAAHPERPAVTFAGESYSYDELNRRANQLAHHLAALGVGPGSCAGLMVERSLDMMVGLLGILKAGGAYVPLDPAYPKERLAYMLADTQAPVLLTQSHLINSLLDHQAAVVCLDTDWPLIARESEANPERADDPEQLAYVIYTSGSTGKPKGVLVTHRNLVHSTSARMNYYPGSVSRFLLLSSFAFDSSVVGIFWSLCQGGNLLMVPEGTQMDVAQLAGVIQAQQVSHMLALPSLYSLLLEHARPDQLTPLRAVIVAGEACHREVIEQHTLLLPQAVLYNEYGPTEGSVWSTVYRIEGGEARVPIGKPIANMRVYLLDGRMLPVPVGVPAELYIGGAGLARGYLNRPEMTAEKFVPNAFANAPGERLYRTGDLACYLPDGNIDFLGRADHQVKVRGYRVELGEIDAALAGHAGVREALTVVREDTPGDRRIVAYLVPHAKNAASIAGHPRHLLPNQMAIVQQNKNESDFLYKDIFENQIYFRHGIELCDGDCVFDVGANTGFFTMFVSQARRDVRVFAFEPLPPTCELLKINAGLYSDGAKVFECGLSDHNGTALFTYYPKFSLMSGRYADRQDEEHVARSYLLNQQAVQEVDGSLLAQYSDELLAGRFETETTACRLTTLSTVIREHRIERIDLLKIDVERSELDVLAGIEEADWPKIRQIVMEVQDIDGRADLIRNQLEARGFEMVIEQEASLAQTNLFNFYAVRRNQAAAAADDAPLALPVFSNPILSAPEIKRFAAERLPEYMVPASVVILEALPLLPNGKVDRSGLPAPERERAAAQVEYVPPSSDLEVLIAGLWAETLKLDAVGIDDNFFDLGGHSFLAIRVHNRLCRELGREVALLKMFQYPTVRVLAQFLGDDQPSPDVLNEQGQDWAERRKEGLRRQRQMRRN